MGVGLAGEGVNETQVIGQVTQPGDEVGDHLAALPAGPERPGALGESSLRPLEGDQLVSAGHRLAVPGDQFGLVIERVEMTAGPRVEDHQHLLRLRGEVGLAASVGVGRIDLRPDGGAVVVAFGLGRQQPITPQQVRESHPSQGRGALRQQSAAIEQRVGER